MQQLVKPFRDDGDGAAHLLEVNQSGQFSFLEKFASGLPCCR